jgi:hypothetical protein
VGAALDSGLYFGAWTRRHALSLPFWPKLVRSVKCSFTLLSHFSRDFFKKVVEPLSQIDLGAHYYL